MSKRDVTWEQVDDLPAPVRGTSGPRSSPYESLIEACKANPGTWYRSVASSPTGAYSRAATLRKHGLDARARGNEVFASLPAA